MCGFLLTISSGVRGLQRESGVGCLVVVFQDGDVGFGDGFAIATEGC